MTVLAFRPRTRLDGAGGPAADESGLTGTFRSPRGRCGVMTGHLRLQRLVLAPRGAFVTGVFSGELRESDGTLTGLRPVVRPLQLDLMGILVHVRAFAIEPALAFPRGPSDPGPSSSPRSRRQAHERALAPPP